MLGQHNDEILSQWLGLSDKDRDELRGSGVI
jgi:crotonobetainyl-CoA:carnitine CoA-transferase CaiB-like acyl-CoA transferase